MKLHRTYWMFTLDLASAQIERVFFNERNATVSFYMATYMLDTGLIGAKRRPCNMILVRI